MPDDFPIAGAMALLCILLAGSAAAEPEPHTVGMYFDPWGTVLEGIAPAFAAPTRLYLLMLNLDEQIVGYELSVAIEGVASEGWVVTRGTPDGEDLDPEPDGYVVEIGVCAGSVGGEYILNSYDFAYFSAPQAPIDTKVCAQPPTVANPTIPGSPSYRGCGGEVRAAPLSCDYYAPGCAFINPSLPYGPCAVSSAEISFGALKARY